MLIVRLPEVLRLMQDVPELGNLLRDDLKTGGLAAVQSYLYQYGLAKATGGIVENNRDVFFDWELIDAMFGKDSLKRIMRAAAVVYLIIWRENQSIGTGPEGSELVIFIDHSKEYYAGYVKQIEVLLK